MSDPQIVSAGSERIAELEPLWVALQDHHAALDAVPPVRPRAASWRRRRRQYERWVGDGSGRLLIADRDGSAVGYLMLRMGDAPSTWDIGDRVAEIETLAVLDGERSGGVGSALMTAALEQIEAAGIRAVGVGVVHSNIGGIRFYERAGFKPFYLQLLRVSD